VIRLADTLEPLAGVLRRGDFDVDAVQLDDLGSCLLAETPHALVLCVASEWETLTATVEEAQAALTNLAARHPSPRSWDLYVALCIERAADEAQEVLRERIEHDTRYARKFVLAGHAADDIAIGRALRPLLPLRETANVRLADPLDAVHTELVNADVDVDVVERAIASFRATGEIEIA
jgi:hypothetical protein